MRDAVITVPFRLQTMPIIVDTQSQPVPTQAMWLKAISLKVDEVDNHTFIVEGETGNHHVVEQGGIYSCSDCDSFTYRATCSHIAAVLFHKYNNQERYSLAMGLVSTGHIVSTEIIGGKMIVRAEKETKRKRKH